jgi:hypothetical protein
MDFLRERLSLTTADPGLSDTFLAELFQPRPEFDQLVAFKDWSAKVQQEMTIIQERKNCPVVWAGLFVDRVGLLLILRFAHPLQLCSAKMAAHAGSREGHADCHGARSTRA